MLQISPPSLIASARVTARPLGTVPGCLVHSCNHTATCVSGQKKFSVEHVSCASWGLRIFWSAIIHAMQVVRIVQTRQNSPLRIDTQL
jgi:hypothetical protein